MGQIIDHQTVVRDGLHNAFTDLVCRGNRRFIVYRKARGHHYDADAVVCLAAADEGEAFAESARFKLPGDCRDPGLAVTPDDRLAVLFVTVTPTDVPDDTCVQQYLAVSTDNGLTFEPPVEIMEPRVHAFRVRRFGDTYYGLLCYRRGRERRLILALSRDLRSWDQVAQIGPDEQLLNEADIHIHDDGEAWVVARTTRKPADHSVFCTASPPYTEWQTVELGLRLHCPSIQAFDGRLYVAGRHRPAMEGDETFAFGNTLCIWELGRGMLTPRLRIPATGDCAYPGFCRDDQGRILISYYSQHAYHLGVLPPFDARVAGGDPDDRQRCRADVYLAEVSLP